MIIAIATIAFACGQRSDDPSGGEPDAVPVDSSEVEEGSGQPASDGGRCTCEQGVCVDQHGGPGEPTGLHCGSWRPAECDRTAPCPCVVDEGECEQDPLVLGLCQCDNGTV